jgi:pyrroline-5-carboxylate reductase
MANKLGCIGGGQMGEALIKGILHSGLYAKEQIVVADPDGDRRQFLERTYSVATSGNSADVWLTSDTVILAVKPQVMDRVLRRDRDNVSDRHLIITIAAGLPLSFYNDCLNSRAYRIIRVMPNTPALVLEGASALSGNENVTAADLQQAVGIFNSVGKAIVVAEEYLDAVTGLSGSGPAYVFTFIEAMIDAGVKCGLPRNVAESLTHQTVLGSVNLLRQSGEHPAVQRSRVTSPGGTTIAGLHVLERAGFSGIIIDAVEAATHRSLELGGKR